MFQSISLESSKEHAATTSWNVAFDIGQKFKERFAKLENLMDHYGDGIRMCHSSPAVSDDGVDEPI